jgi:hypothetical protein
MTGNRTDDFQAGQCDPATPAGKAVYPLTVVRTGDSPAGVAIADPATA